MINELRSIIKTLHINKENAIAVPEGADWLDHDLEVSPEDFLEQAKRDYELGGNSALLNSITNAKRAIRCQIDKVLFCVGYDPIPMKIRDKVKLLNSIGFAAPRILRKVDNARNLLEHQYKNPSLQEVEDSLDLALLFIEALNRSVKPIGSDFSLVNEGNYVQEPFECYRNELLFHFDTEKKCFKIWGEERFFRYPNAKYLTKKEIGSVIVRPYEMIFPDVLRIALNIEKGRERKTKDAVTTFLIKVEKT